MRRLCKQARQADGTCLYKKKNEKQLGLHSFSVIMYLRRHLKRTVVSPQPVFAVMHLPEIQFTAGNRLFYAGLLTNGSSHGSDPSQPHASGYVQSGSPNTVAGPRGILTRFPLSSLSEEHKTHIQLQLYCIKSICARQVVHKRKMYKIN